MLWIVFKIVGNGFDVLGCHYVGGLDLALSDVRAQVADNGGNGQAAAFGNLLNR